MATRPNLHAHLLRQLRRAGVTVEAPPSAAQWAKLLNEVSDWYKSADDNTYRLERALELSSGEMAKRNEGLLQQRNRLERELEIAMQLQTSILPQDWSSATCEAAARMTPAAEVGGDYYDIIPVESGCWIAIGDVVGHGLRSAIVMTMVQSMVSVIAREQRELSPRDVVLAVNRAVHENVFRRLKTNDHVTFSALRCEPDGRVTYAGAHEDMIIYRAQTGACERVDTAGAWLGPLSDLSSFTENRSFKLERGDILVLYTDGVIEARNAERKMFGIERIEALVAAHHDDQLAALCDRVLDACRAWTQTQQDDMTVLFYRQTV